MREDVVKGSGVREKQREWYNQQLGTHNEDDSTYERQHLPAQSAQPKITLLLQGLNEEPVIICPVLKGANVIQVIPKHIKTIISIGTRRKKEKAHV